LKNINKFIFVLGLFFASPSCAASVVTVEHSIDGWRIKVDGKPYFIRGMCYDPHKIGTEPNPNNNSLKIWSIVDEDGDGINDLAYQTWVDKNNNNARDWDEKDIGDFKLLKQMGVNTIRIYHHPSDNPELVALNANFPWYNHAPNKKLYRELYENFGIMLMMGDLLGAYTTATGTTVGYTDYTDSQQRANMLKSVEDMVNEFKDEPYILLWTLGNENEHRNSNTNALKNPEEFLDFVDKAAQLIKQLDNNRHPVGLIMLNINNYVNFSDKIPNIDIIGNNNYSYSNFGNLWTRSEMHYGRPVLITEYGNNKKVGEKRQADMHKSLWLDIRDHAAGYNAPGNAIGGFPFTFTDVWWLYGNPWGHEVEGAWNFEWSGMTSQGVGQGAIDNSPLMRQLRPVYYKYQSLWATSIESP